MHSLELYMVKIRLQEQVSMVRVGYIYVSSTYYSCRLYGCKIFTLVASILFKRSGNNNF